MPMTAAPPKMGKIPVSPPTKSGTRAAITYGKRNVDLPKDMQDDLRTIIYKTEEANRMARAEEVRRVQRQREFFRGNQNIFYDYYASKWAQVNETSLLMPNTDGMPAQAIKYDFVENLYRVECLLHIAILRQNPPGVQFRPQNFEQPEDVATAREAKVAGDFVVRNNDLERRMADAIWYLDHDGRCLSYTYWELSSELYGQDWFQNTEEQMQTVPGKAVCPDCGYEQSEMPMDGMCPECAMGGQAPMDGEQMPMDGGMGEQMPKPPMAVPMQAVPPTKTPVDVPVGDPFAEPRGQERAIFVGALETNVPFMARTLYDCGWLTWECEVDKSYLKTIYPQLEEASMQLPESMDTGDASDSRSARLALAGTSWGRLSVDDNSEIVTFRRTWIRPWQFAIIKEEARRKALMEAFPDGAYVAFSGADYCESRSEAIEKRWKWVPAYPGDGMMRDGWLTDFMDVQRKINTGENIKFETFERGLGTRFIDTGIIDWDAYLDQGSQAGNEFGVATRPGEKVGDKIYESAPMSVSPQLIADMDMTRGPRSEKITGNFAAAYGGDTGTNDTARGIVEVKDSAMGRMSYFKEILNELYAGTVVNLIKCLVEHRKGELRYAVEGPTGDLDAAIIHLDQLQGNFYAMTTAEDSYPTSPAQQRATIIQVLQGPPNPLQQALFAPENYDLVRWAVGSEIKLPGEQARRKQMREIQLAKQGVFSMVDAMLDQHDYEIGALNEWASSEDGQAADPAVRQWAAKHMTDHLMGKAAVAKVIQGTMPQDPATAGAPAEGGEAMVA